jgi:hypothetical protein
MTSTGKAPEGEPFAIELGYSHTVHHGDETRQSMKQIEDLAVERREAANLGRLVDAVEAAAKPLAQDFKRETKSLSSENHFGARRGPLYFDGGIDTTYLVNVLATAAGAVPLSLLIKGAKDALVAWLNHRSIKVKLGGGREVNVQSVGQLDEVLERLKESEEPAKPPARKRARKKSASKKRAAKRRSAPPRAKSKTKRPGRAKSARKRKR